MPYIPRRYEEKVGMTSACQGTRTTFTGYIITKWKKVSKHQELRVFSETQIHSDQLDFSNEKTNKMKAHGSLSGILLFLVCMLNSHLILSFSSGGSLFSRSLPVCRPAESCFHWGDSFSGSALLVQKSQDGSRSSPTSVKPSFLSKLGAEDEMFDISTTFGLIGGQAVLVVIAVGVAVLTKTPNFGLGTGVSFGWKSVGYGVLMTLPLGGLAWVLDQVEENVPALKDVTTATQRSVLALMGSTFKPKLGFFVALMLGIAAGLGEEMLFRGVLQYELIGRMGSFVALGLTSIVFGLAHAVTPVYAFLATLASVYFGYLYLDTGNLAVPIVTHALYDVFALMYAHWCVANLSETERAAVAEWEGPGTGR